MVETDSFTASRLKLDEYGLGERTADVNRDRAPTRARAADAFSTPERPRFVAGSLGPTGMLISSSDPSLSKITFDELADLYGEQARHWSKAASTAVARDEARSARAEGRDRRHRARVRARDAPGADSGPGDARLTGRMLLGTDIRAVCATLDALPIDVDRAQLLDRSHPHARRGALPLRERRAATSASSPTPACR